MTKAEEKIRGIWKATDVVFENCDETPLYPYGEQGLAYAIIIYADYNIVSAHLGSYRGTFDRPGEPYMGYSGTYEVKPDGNTLLTGQIYHFIECMPMSFWFYLLPTTDQQNEMYFIRDYELFEDDPGKLVLSFTNQPAIDTGNKYTWAKGQITWSKVEDELPRPDIANCIEHSGLAL
ncbi:MAG: lipocalin-like domain-containing protein [Desulfobacterales bacterium]|nr:lipocalin-like domain-containing protein [Desulfobacterales bacterium]